MSNKHSKVTFLQSDSWSHDFPPTHVPLIVFPVLAEGNTILPVVQAKALELSLTFSFPPCIKYIRYSLGPSLKYFQYPINSYHFSWLQSHQPVLLKVYSTKSSRFYHGIATLYLSHGSQGEPFKSSVKSCDFSTQNHTVILRSLAENPKSLQGPTRLYNYWPLHYYPDFISTFSSPTLPSHTGLLLVRTHQGTLLALSPEF